MARPRQPIDVIVSKGKSHKTKAEIEQRRKNEVKPLDTKIIVPEFITDPQHVKQFKHIAKDLDNLKVWSELDADTLGKYIVSQATYEAYLEPLRKAVEAEDYKDYSLSNSLQLQQDRAFKQAHTCATALGLTITSRCKLVVPVEDDEIPDL